MKIAPGGFGEAAGSGEPARGAAVFVCLALAIAASAALFTSPAVAKPPPPRSPSQPAQDGCQRSNFGIGFNTSPQLVYVYRKTKIRKAVGVSRVTHPALEDSQLQHNWYDFNGNLEVEQQYRYLLGGNPKHHTGNFAGDDEETGRLHYEWEEHTLPHWAWPTDGDRTTIWGSWIWDCGHWTTGSENNTSGKVTGEHTEFHPLNAIVVHRRTPYHRSRRVSQTDVFISNEGTKAHAVEKCAHKHHPASGAPYPQYDSGFNPCAMSRENRIQRLKDRYKFFVPAPSRPSRGSQLRYRVETRGHSAGHERIRVKPDGLQVTVSLKGGKRPVSYGKSFIVWWAGQSRTGRIPLKVTLKSLLIRHSDPEPIYNAKKSPWNLYLDLNGDWTFLNRWAPKLDAVHDGQKIAINKTIKIYVRRNSRVWLQTSGRECDEPSGTQVFGVDVNLVHPCPANKTEQNPDVLRFLQNDGTGTILDVYGSPRAALGKHVSNSAAKVRFPGTGRVGFTHDDQGDKAYRLKYTVRRAG